jgi:isoleucyl-tRNA synthetase
VDEGLERNIAAVIRIKNLALNLRMQSKMKTRQPLPTLYVRPRDAHEKSVLSNPKYVSEVLEEVNIKNLSLIEDESKLGTLRLKPETKTVAPRAGKLLKAVSAALASLDANAALRTLQETGSYALDVDGQKFELAKADVQVVFEGPSHFKALWDEGTFVCLDTRLTPELLHEGIARDFNRHVQEQRKAMNLAVTDRIRIQYSAPPDIVHAITAFDEYLRHELLAESIQFQPVDTNNGGVRLRLSGHDVAVSIRQL